MSAPSAGIESAGRLGLNAPSISRLPLRLTCRVVSWALLTREVTAVGCRAYPFEGRSPPAASPVIKQSAKRFYREGRVELLRRRICISTVLVGHEM